MTKKDKARYSEYYATKAEAKKLLEYYMRSMQGLVFYQSLDKRITLAVYPAIRGNAPRFFRVSAAYCSPTDKPRKYAGMLQALGAESLTVSADRVREVADAFMGFNNYTLFD